MYWKDKLEGLDSLSHEDWDKDVLWDQLAVRINYKRSNRKLYRGLIAVAACLLLLTGLIWISTDKQDASPVSYILYKPIDTKKTEYTESFFRKEEVTLNKEKKEIRNNVVGNNIVDKKELIEPIPSTEETETMSEESTNEKDNISSPTIADSTVASKSPQRKLRVVHINEVGKPVIESIKIARVSQSINDRSTHRTAPVYFSDNSDDNIFKINLFPNN